MNPANYNHRTRITALLLTLILTAALMLSPGARAQGSEKIVRVGWYESPFNITDELGRRSGYAYEYQQRIAAYTGWTYEYVEGSWPELLQMLSDGRIDLLSDVSFTEERTEKMLFSSLPMGTEDYYLFVAPGNEEISPENHASFNGKTVGANRGSIQISFFRDWAEANGVQVRLLELTGTEEENIARLNRGDIDMYATLDGFESTGRAVPVCRIGWSDFFFAVSKDQPELLSELNTAMSRIQDENQFYNQQLYSKYIKTSSVNRYLSAEESAWLTGHGPIRVGYRDNYLAFCAADPKTGELTGALKEYLRVASDCLANAHLEFEAVAYPTSEDAMDALKRGEVDCMFPANLSDYDGEQRGVFITPALMRTDMSAVIREDDQKTFSKKDRVAVAVNVGNPNYDIFLLDHFPEWRAIYFVDTPECLRAIADGQADCLLISNYRFNNIARLCSKYHLTTISTGVEMDDCFAVNRGDTVLYSILSKTTDLVPASTVNAALSYYFTEDAKTGLVDLVKQNLGLAVSVFAAVVLVILLLLLRNVRSERKARDEQRLIRATETDVLTGLYSRNYFYEYAGRMVREHPDKPMDAVVLSVEQLRSLSDRSFDARILRGMGDEIRAFLQENGGIAGHAETDRFAIYCSHPEDYQVLYERLQRRLDLLSEGAGVRLRMGVMPWQTDTEPTELFEYALRACALAQEDRREGPVFFDERLRERAAFERRLLSDLPRALSERELEVHYQPKYDIQAEPPRLKSAEALVRWRHPELGLIEPDGFLPLLERNARIAEVDRFVWAEAARQVADWKEKFGRSVPVSVNLSRLDVFDPTLDATLDGLLQEYGLSNGELKLELTEAICAEEPYRVPCVVERLRRKGYEIEIDDFGTGSSSLNTLSSMPIDVLKMDRIFVSNLDQEDKALHLVELILSISRYLKVPIVAEGVETEEQLKLLKKLGCALAQGYYFSRPLPAPEFEKAVLSKALSKE